MILTTGRKASLINIDAHQDNNAYLLNTLLEASKVIRTIYNRENVKNLRKDLARSLLEQYVYNQQESP